MYIRFGILDRLQTPVEYSGARAALAAGRIRIRGGCRGLQAFRTFIHIVFEL